MKTLVAAVLTAGLSLSAVADIKQEARDLYPASKPHYGFQLDGSFGGSPSRFNPTELSNAQKQFIHVYKQGDASGVIGKIFWLKAAGKVMSYELSTLQNLSKTERTDFIKESIYGEIVADVIAQSKVDIDTWKQLHEATTGVLLDVISGKNVVIADLEADVAALVATVAARDVTIEGLELDIEGLEADVAELVATVAARDLTIEGLNANIAALESTVARQSNTIGSLQVTVSSLSSALGAASSQIASLEGQIAALDGVIEGSYTLAQLEAAEAVAYDTGWTEARQQYRANAVGQLQDRIGRELTPEEVASITARDGGLHFRNAIAIAYQAGLNVEEVQTYTATLLTGNGVTIGSYSVSSNADLASAVQSAYDAGAANARAQFEGWVSGADHASAIERADTAGHFRGLVEGLQNGANNARDGVIAGANNAAGSNAFAVGLSSYSLGEAIYNTAYADGFAAVTRDEYTVNFNGGSTTVDITLTNGVTFTWNAGGVYNAGHAAGVASATGTVSYTFEDVHAGWASRVGADGSAPRGDRYATDADIFDNAPQGVDVFGAADAPISNLYSGELDSITVVLSDISQEIDAALQASYDNGYEDGYNDGYADGYEDGFADGRASN